MKKYKKIIIFLLTIIIVTAYVIRVWNVNKDIDKSVVKEYAKGEIVPFEDDYIRTDDESTEGYSIEVLDSKIYTKKEFMEEFDADIKDNEGVKYVCKADIRIYNDNKELNTEMGIFLLFLPLLSERNYIMASEDLTLHVNPDLPAMSFCLRPESNMDISIIYELTEPMFTDYNMKKVQEENFMICMTQYPTRKMLHIK